MDALGRHLAERLALAKRHLVEAARDPRCPHCGHAADDEWMTARDLKQCVYKRPEWKYGESGTIGCALFDLLEEGVIEQRSDLRIRLRTKASSPGLT